VPRELIIFVAWNSRKNIAFNNEILLGSKYALHVRDFSGVGNIFGETFSFEGNESLLA